MRSLFADGTRAVDTLVALQVRDSTPGREEFGNGHASLVEVRGLPVTGITIDSSYVKTLPTGGRDLSLLRTIIELAHSLGLTAVIDGVNTQAAWRDLVDLGCDSAQGWLVAPVMPPEALPGWLGRRETGSIDFLVDQESADAPASIAAVRSKLPVSDQIGVRCPASARHS